QRPEFTGPKTTDPGKNGFPGRLPVLTLTDRFGIEKQREVHINRHAPVTAHGSLKDQAAAFIETALEEFSASL
ncbi:MAG: hypothetical protein O2856_19605, partial [Planctomycetota bacterium]|nr:hypothetical protein [Planctomycetota bacterium]